MRRTHVRSRTVAALAALAVLAGAAVTAATPAEASTPHNGLSDVWCASPSSCVAVGVSGPSNDNPVAGRPLAETWNGKHWTAVAVRLPAGAASGGLNGLSCVRATSCVAVGYWGSGFTGHELAESWNGRTWTPSEPPAPAGEQTALQGVSCPSAGNCFAVGEYEASAATGLPAAVVERLTGGKWTEVKLGLPGGLAFSSLGSVSCPSAKQCVAVGILFNKNVGAVLVESWNGTAWKRVSAPSPGGGAVPVLTGVSCLSAVSCVAVGDTISGLNSATGFAESWNGRAWTMTAVPWPRGSVNSVLFRVSCRSTKSCVAVGGTGENPNAGADNSGRAAAATWNGRKWAVVPVPAPARGQSSLFQGVSCPLTASCVAVGKAGPTGSTAGNGLSGFWNGKVWGLRAAI
jgi:hypothetical protein